MVSLSKLIVLLVTHVKIPQTLNHVAKAIINLNLAKVSFDCALSQINNFQDHCKICEKGHYCDVTGMTAQQPCEDGTVSTTEGKFKCDECPAGSFCTHSGVGSKIHSSLHTAFIHSLVKTFIAHKL